MAKKKDSLEEFAFLSQIKDTFPGEKPKQQKTSKIAELEKEEGGGEVIQKTIIKSPGKPRGQFVMEMPTEMTSSIKNVSIFTDIHEDLIDLVYFISKQNKKTGKNKVSLLGVTNVALIKGIEILKKEYKL